MGKVCPFLSKGEAMQDCIEEACMLYGQPGNDQLCALTQLPAKTVVRLDALSAQVQELQVLLNQIENGMK